MKKILLIILLLIASVLVLSGEEGKPFYSYDNEKLNKAFYLIIENMLKILKES